MKLKTLKEFELHKLLDSPAFNIISSVSKAVIIKGEIRNLAINWVKNKEQTECPVCHKSKNSPCDYCNSHWFLRFIGEDWIKFFNITEKDLK